MLIFTAEVTKIIIKGVGDVISYVNGTNESYLRQLEAKPAPVMPTDPTGLPDLTKEIDEWLLGKEQQFNNMKEVEWNKSIKEVEWPKNMGLLKWTKYITHPYVATSFYFYNQVKTGGEMDIKQEKAWDEAFDAEYTSFFIYRGDIMDPGTLGNITYGYIGASLFPDFMLYMGAGYASMDAWDEGKYVFAFPFLPLFGDAPEDYEAVKKGIEMYKNKCND